uniref:Uncharacterized protein n=1 Tax=Meloidogyne enterolobii TaxID=390850 RepID=A0A6V7TZF8_MELEN|nr:unnamed protein product [Meloidogyne enterolobii]
MFDSCYILKFKFIFKFPGNNLPQQYNPIAIFHSKWAVTYLRYHLLIFFYNKNIAKRNIYSYSFLFNIDELKQFKFGAILLTD